MILLNTLDSMEAWSCALLILLLCADLWHIPQLLNLKCLPYMLRRIETIKYYITHLVNTSLLARSYYMRPLGSYGRLGVTEHFKTFLAFDISKLRKFDCWEIPKHLQSLVDWILYLAKSLSNPSALSVPFVQVCLRGIVFINCRELK